MARAWLPEDVRYSGFQQPRSFSMEQQSPPVDQRSKLSQWMRGELPQILLLLLLMGAARDSLANH